MDMFGYPSFTNSLISKFIECYFFVYSLFLRYFPHVFFVFYKTISFNHILYVSFCKEYWIINSITEGFIKKTFSTLAQLLINNYFAFEELIFTPHLITSTTVRNVKNKNKTVSVTLPNIYLSLLYKAIILHLLELKWCLNFNFFF